MRRNLNGRTIRSSSPAGFENTTILRHSVQRLPLIMAYDDQAHLNHTSNSNSVSYNDNSSSTGLLIGVCSEQGRRPYQEDEYSIRLFLSSKSHQNDSTIANKSTLSAVETHFFALFDGHAGGRCSKYVSSTFADNLTDDPSYFSNLSLALRRCYHTTNENFLKIAEKMKLHDGSTGICAVIRDCKLIVSNVGDCRAVIVTNSGKVVPMSNDQKPTMVEEQKRIASLGGVVINCMGVSRVNGVLAVSRAFGNRSLKQVIKPDAEIMTKDLTKEDEYLVLASDGLWDVLRNKDVGDICHSFRNNGNNNLTTLNGLAEELVHMAISKGSMDNVTCIVVKLTGYINRVSSSVSPNTTNNVESNIISKVESSSSLSSLGISNQSNSNSKIINATENHRQQSATNIRTKLHQANIYGIVDSNSHMDITNSTQADIVNESRGSSAFTSSKKVMYPLSATADITRHNASSSTMQSYRRPNSVGPSGRRSGNISSTSNTSSEHKMPILQPYTRNAVTPSPTLEYGRILSSPLTLFVDSNKIAGNTNILMTNSLRRPTPRRNNNTI